MKINPFVAIEENSRVSPKFFLACITDINKLYEGLMTMKKMKISLK